MPVRDLEWYGGRAVGVTVHANRGANGIDGQVSTFLGWCEPAHDNICVVGDLTAIYDLNAPWVVPQLGDVRFRIVVVNNGGGRIFSRVASLRVVDPALRERIIENVHDVRFEHWAAMWNIDVTEQESWSLALVGYGWRVARVQKDNTCTCTSTAVHSKVEARNRHKIVRRGLSFAAIVFFGCRRERLL